MQDKTEQKHVALKLPNLSDLHNESDVEQKLVYPLLVEPKPYGFEIPVTSILTKANIRRFKIDKGTAGKIYFPDYLIIIAGFPLVVIEAKAPTEDVIEAYREARLYAGEINAQYQSGLNPVQLVIATNGSRLLNPA